MLTWLQNDLASTAQPWIIAFFHHPPYSKGSHDSDTEIELREMRQNALPILEKPAWTWCSPGTATPTSARS